MAEPKITTIEQTDYAWLIDRWETGLVLGCKSYWARMANYMHCCAMAVWDMSRPIALEYLLLASLCDTLEGMEESE